MTIKQLRAEKSISQKEFSEKIGCHASRIAMIETGKRKLQVEMAKTIGEAFEIPWYILFEDEQTGNTG